LWLFFNERFYIRVCGEHVSAAGRVSYWTWNSKVILKTVFSIDVEHDDPLVHPSKYCHIAAGV